MAIPEENWPHIPGTPENGKLPYGWAGEHSIPNNIGFARHKELYQDIINWIYENISNSVGNVYWTKIGDCFYFQFRKEKDLLMFLLRWG